ncbi:hypothetical protein D0T25_24350 [Duganella sp. BJB488]|nr:hypothetical protein D0T26_23270 [Duganella sp. BJB489]RFP17214.1 hypothetical protein D0T25_24350 [Duganella sp. BJB488]RFP31566.1 hypothetical protein D0T24_24365 [Duganella sp. BJB480]
MGIRQLPRAPKRIRVDAQTFEHLELAQTVNLVVKDAFVAGAGNQRLDILASGGESWARRELATTKFPRGNTESQLQRVQYAQGGHCSTHAALSAAMLAQHALKAPVVQIWENEMDHVYALIGDPRDPVYGEKNTVVVDPWVGAPSACTLAEARLHDAGSGEVTKFRPERGLRTGVYNPGQPMPAQQVNIARNIYRMDTEQVDKRLAKINKTLRKDGVGIGAGLVDHIRRGQDAGTLFDCRVSTDPRTEYENRSTGQVKTFDALSPQTADRLRRGDAAMNAIMRTEGRWRK